jgi:cell division protein FtsL
MSRNALSVLLIVLVVAIAAAGFVWYDHQRRTVLEVNVGDHGISVQKN